ncbi:hypothetical protein Mnod_2478 [Methylobacterium nodulans ORS 2060]|uniref:Uncharacterized protein n=1 Tax=Methylobacterium nodulans (strain LMG 21967 / CNCM I-2342 / ORS 2060) TaxID=460265 RepID=B8ICN7_METNO|nr:hypothetical protein Mnod_2478 [Methylobacterium nodulans ORS 2060]
MPSPAMAASSRCSTSSLSECAFACARASTASRMVGRRRTVSVGLFATPSALRGLPLGLFSEQGIEIFRPVRNRCIPDRRTVPGADCLHALQATVELVLPMALLGQLTE